jgi:hypothetical protein
VALAEFVEPVVLQRYAQRCLETDDSDDGSRDIREVAIKAVQEHDRGTASLPQESAAEWKRGEKDEKEIAEVEHRVPLSEDRGNYGA